MPSCPPVPLFPPKKSSTGSGTRKTPDLRLGALDDRWKKPKSMCPPCKGVYTWMSPSKVALIGQKSVRLLGGQVSDKPKTIHSRLRRGSNFCHFGEGDVGEKLLPTKPKCLAPIKVGDIKPPPVMRHQRHVIGTPPPFAGRRHETIQTEKYLEELFDHPQEFDAGVQTDLFLQRPPSPVFVPQKTGIDAETQILDGELFDFYMEVQPIVEALVGRTIEQAVIEVMHEEELADLKEQQQRLLSIREREEAEIQRLELQECRLEAEKKRRRVQDEITKSIDKEMQERVTAAKLLQGHINDLLPGILEQMEPLRDEEDRKLQEETLKPWLVEQVAEEIGQMIDSRDLLEEIVKQVLQHRAELYLNMPTTRTEAVGDDTEAGEEEEIEHEEEIKGAKFDE